MSETRVCKKCALSKQVEEFPQYKKKNGAYSRRGYCVSCHRQYQQKVSAQWRSDNKQYVIEKRKVYYLLNKEQIKEKVRKWEVNNKDRCNATSRRYYARDKRDGIIRNAYVYKCLGATSKNKYPESFIEIKRLQLQIKRLIEDRNEKHN